MRYHSILLCLILSGTAPAQSEAEPLLSEKELVDTLDQDNLQEAIRILLKSYIKRDNLNSLELNRAALQGLLERSGIGVTLVDRSSENGDHHTPQKLVAESITKEIAYIRPGSLSSDEVGSIGPKLEGFRKAGAETLILDLRVPAETATFQNAARLLNHFSPPNELLFKIQKPGEQRPSLFQSRPATSWDGDLVLLIDHQTPPAAEAVAQVLKRLRNPIIVGTTTPGETVEYNRVIIGDQAYLRFAVAEVVFGEGESIFREGVSPDLEAKLEAADKAYIFDASEESGMKPFIFSKKQPRHNEAALVAGTNPELDYAIAKSAGRDTGYDTVPIHDRVVQAALDYLVTAELIGAE